MSLKSSVQRARRKRRWTSAKYWAKENVLDCLVMAVVGVIVVDPPYVVNAFTPYNSIAMNHLNKVCYTSCTTPSRDVPSIRIHATKLNMSGLFGEKDSSQRSKTKPPPSSDTSWQIFIDQSKASLDRGGSATLDAFICLTSSASSNIQVIPCILPKSALTSLSKSSKRPLVRCVSNVPGRPSLDASNVDSVDKVYRLLTKHMRVQGINYKACDCLKWKYQGNGHLEAGKVSLAIDAYNKALATDVAHQEGVILLLRASAYLQQAESHKAELQTTVEELTEMTPDISTLEGVIVSELLSRNDNGDGSEGTVDDDSISNDADIKGSSKGSVQHPASSLTMSLLNRVLQEGKRQEDQFRKTQFHHGLYQYSLLHAAQDSLRATELLPTYSTSWLRAGEILMDLWKIKESTQYYERAIALDSSLEESLSEILERLGQRQKFLELARSNGWPEDTLRLALDVAAE